MTQSSLQTHCPKCDTRFRVTDAQLSVAKGKVRCGNCMSVFNAIEHKIEEPAPSAPEKPETTEQNSAPEPDSGDNLLFADNPEEDAAESNYTGTRLTFTEDELSDSFRSVDQPGKNADFEDDENEESVDESWAEAILSDDDEPQAAPDTRPENEPSPDPMPEQTPAPAKEQAPETQTIRENSSPPKPESSAITAWNGEPGISEEDDFDSFFIDNEPEPKKSELPYQNLRSDPVAIRDGGNKRLRTLLWSVVVLALLCGLASQVVWFQFDRLSAIPQLRPLYEQGCDIFGCTLKPLVDVQSIQSRKLVVKTDPENRQQLIVDAVIINRAAFEQPFPAIALTFSNLNNDVVAQSVFTPDEYLAGDGKKLSSMPTDTPARILINIRDPGKDAVNYNIAFKAYSP